MVTLKPPSRRGYKGQEALKPPGSPAPSGNYCSPKRDSCVVQTLLGPSSLLQAAGLVRTVYLLAHPLEPGNRSSVIVVSDAAKVQSGGAGATVGQHPLPLLRPSCEVSHVFVA